MRLKLIILFILLLHNLLVAKSTSVNLLCKRRITLPPTERMRFIELSNGYIFSWTTFKNNEEKGEKLYVQFMGKEGVQEKTILIDESSFGVTPLGFYKISNDDLRLLYLKRAYNNEWLYSINSVRVDKNYNSGKIEVIKTIRGWISYPTMSVDNRENV